MTVFFAGQYLCWNTYASWGGICNGLGVLVVPVTIAAPVIEAGVEVGFGAGGSDHGEDGLIHVLGRFPVGGSNIIVCIVAVLEPFWEMHGSMALRHLFLDKLPSRLLFRVSIVRSHGAEGECYGSCRGGFAGVIGAMHEVTQVTSNRILRRRLVDARRRAMSGRQRWCRFSFFCCYSATLVEM